jgi:hypothetical protein
VISFARGEWCPFCRSFAEELQLHAAQAVADKGGRVIVAASQEPALIPEVWARTTPKFPHKFSLDFFQDKGAVLGRQLGVVVEQCADSRKLSQYPAGMTQPGVFVLRPGAAAGEDWQQLVRWTHVSKLSNLYGAVGRPDVEELLQVAFAALDNVTQPDEAPRALHVARSSICGIISTVLKGGAS